MLKAIESINRLRFLFNKCFCLQCLTDREGFSPRGRYYFNFENDNNFQKYRGCGVDGISISLEEFNLSMKTWDYQVCRARIAYGALLRAETFRLPYAHEN